MLRTECFFIHLYPSRISLYKIFYGLGHAKNKVPLKTFRWTDTSITLDKIIFYLSDLIHCSHTKLSDSVGVLCFWLFIFLNSVYFLVNVIICVFLALFFFDEPINGKYYPINVIIFFDEVSYQLQKCFPMYCFNQIIMQLKICFAK